MKYKIFVTNLAISRWETKILRNMSPTPFLFCCSGCVRAAVMAVRLVLLLVLVCGALAGPGVASAASANP